MSKISSRSSKGSSRKSFGAVSFMRVSKSHLTFPHKIPLCTSQDEFKLNLHIHSNYSLKQSPIKSIKHKVPSCDHLILVSKGDKKVFIYGFTISEYYLFNDKGSINQKVADQLLIHIDKIDSTGFHQCTFALDGKQTSLGRWIIQEYLKYTLERKPADQISVHVFSRSQPEYLFVGSSKNGFKAQVQHKKLVEWWKKTLIYSKGTLKCFVPNESLSDSEFPFQLGNRVTECIPLFKGDAKCGLFESMSERDSKEMNEMTCKDFMVLLQVLPECTGQNVSGLFKLDFKVENAEILQFEFEDAIDYDALFDSTDFSTISKAESSTAQVLKALEFTSTSHILPKAAVIECFKRKEAQPVNDVSAFIKRKKVC